MATKKSSGKAAKSTKTTTAAKNPKVKQEKPLAAATQPAEVVIDKPSFASLRSWQLLAAGLLAVQAVLLLVFHATKSYPVFAGFLAKDPLQSAAQGETVLVFAVHHLLDVNLAYFLAGLLAIAAIVYVLMSTAWRPRVEAGLTLGRNPRRWYGNALVSGLAVTVVGMLVGAQDISLLLAVLGLTAVFYLAESIAERRRRYALRTMVVGKMVGLLAWIVIGLYILFGLLYGNALSVYVYVTAGIMYVLAFASVAAFSWMQYKAKGRWADQLFAERAYLIQNVVMLSALTWLLFVGVFR